MTNEYYIGQINSALNLVGHYFTGSRAIVETNTSNTFSPAGSYTTIMKLFDKTTDQGIMESNGGKDKIIFFDNNQVLSRNWSVKYDSKALVSVITPTVELVPPKNYMLQSNLELAPYTWLTNVHVE